MGHKMARKKTPSNFTAEEFTVKQLSFSTERQSFLTPIGYGYGVKGEICCVNGKLVIKTEGCRVEVLAVNKTQMKALAAFIAKCAE